jgi:phosphatidylglycerol:prolipoprotein diacylglycerol transferase
MSIYGLLIGIAFAIGAEYFSRHNNIIPKPKETFFIFFLFLSSIIGARIYSVISDLNYYQKDPIQILNTRAGGLGIFGGLLFGLLFIFIFSRIKNLSFLKILNIITPIVPLGQAIGRWGNFVNHEVYSLSGLPVWFYESILDFILFLILIKTKKNQTAVYLIGYGIIRFFLEFLRSDTFVINHIKIGQILSLAFILIGIMIISHKESKIKNYGRNNKFSAKYRIK